MKRNRILAIGLTSVIAIGSVVSTSAYADAGHSNAESRSNGVAHGNMTRGYGGQSGMMGGQPGHAMMQKMMQMHGQMMGSGQDAGMRNMMDFDADADGIISAEEARAAKAAKLAEFDENGDGSLSIGEYETLFAAAMREQMVDRFQMLDNDGDGIVTLEEMAASDAKRRHMINGQLGMGRNNASMEHVPNN